MTTTTWTNQTRTPLVSVIIVNTNECHHLARCLPTIRQQSYPSIEVVIIDNHSTDGSVDYIRSHFPEMRVIESEVNLGYPGANNLGFELAHGEYFAVLNPDTALDPDWLAELVQALESHPEAGLATSKILLMDDPSRINACGNDVSVAGLTFCRGVGEPSTAFERQEEVLAVSGAAFLVRRSTIATIGPFDADFVSYLEETDLSLRARLADIRSLYVPTSRAYHQYSFRFSEKKCFHIEKNRYYMLVKLLHLRTLLLLAPILLFADMLVWGYMVMKGRRYIYQKLRSYQWLWQNRRMILVARADAQCQRRISDRELLQLFIPQLLFHQMVQRRLATLLDSLTTPILSRLSNVALRFVT